MVRATPTTIEIFLGTERIAAHKRNYNPNKRYTTLPEHMPENHRAVSAWSSERFIAWAEKIGPNTGKLIEHILNSREYPVQTYRTCMGIMRLTGSYTPEIVECASLEAVQKRTWSSKYFAAIIKQLAKGIEVQQSSERIIEHDNVRGKNAYKGGGIFVQ